MRRGSTYTGKLADQLFGNTTPETNTNRLLPAVSAVKQYLKTLLIGQVQSGKTQAYLDIASQLVSDKDSVFSPKFVVILAGTHSHLRAQTSDRVSEIQTSLRTLEDSDCEFQVFLKNRNDLEKALSAVERARIDGRPVLIIDDESDQASPNNQAAYNISKSEYKRSAVNEAMVKLVAAVLHQNDNGTVIGRYLACTATPAATLLTPRTDILSCDTAVILPPHNKYFSLEDAQRRMVLLQDSTSDDESDMDAWAFDIVLYYFAGAALERLDNRNAPLRQLMVHVAQKTENHELCKEKILGHVRGWLGYLANPDEFDQGSREVLALHTAMSTFFKIDLDIWRNAGFYSLASDVLSTVLTQKDAVVVVNMNSKTSQDAMIDAQVLVGGAMLSRGITIPNLITSAVFRTVSDKTPLDNVHQWARFCGPRVDYEQYCSILVTSNVREAFDAIVRADNDLRTQLQNSEVNGIAFLPAWRRSFLLEANRITRKGVVGLNMAELAFGEGWNLFRKFDADESRCKRNDGLLEELVSTFGLRQNDMIDIVGHDAVSSFFEILSKFEKPLSAQFEPYLSDIPVLLADAKGFTVVLPGNKVVQDRAIDWKSDFSGYNGESADILAGAINNVFSNQIEEGKLFSSELVTLHIRRIQPKNTDTLPEVMGALFLPSGQQSKVRTDEVMPASK